MPKKKDDVVENPRTVKVAYRLWLNNYINSSFRPIKTYSQVLAFLFRAPFMAHYELDENRIGDIMGLRDKFSESSKLENTDYMDLLHMDPSILELMISMAIRINDLISTDDDISKYFWDMMESLGLADMDDTKFNFSEASKRIEAFLTHNYLQNGKGGLFWIKKPAEGYDATKVDIYTQSQVYINHKGGVL